MISIETGKNGELDFDPTIYVETRSALRGVACYIVQNDDWDGIDESSIAVFTDQLEDLICRLQEIKKEIDNND